MSEPEEKKEEIKDDPYLKSPKAFHLEMPLYHNIDLSPSGIAKKVYACISYYDTIDAYCVWCEKDSVFNTDERIYINPHIQESTLNAWKTRGNGFNRISHSCTRNSNHKYYAYYYKANNIFLKIGQFPSSADFQIPQVEHYRKILGEERYTELTKGIGLAAHDVGIGSFVYLRRVFENLIEEAHINAKIEKKDFDDEKYTQSRMDEKIKIVKEFLPEFLVENRKLYAILSKGIHELTEDECMQYFDTVKIGIEQILDEKIIQKQKTEKMDVARKAIQKAHGEITK